MTRFNGLRDEHIFGLPAVGVVFDPHGDAPVPMQLNDIDDATEFLCDFGPRDVAFAMVADPRLVHQAGARKRIAGLTSPFGYNYGSVDNRGTPCLPLVY